MARHASRAGRGGGDGRLVLARGYGWSDVENRIGAVPDGLFRIASISKPITAAAIMTLVERGQLAVCEHPFEILADLTGQPGTTRDQRLAGITIEQLLRHSGGWRQVPYYVPGRPFGQPEVTPVFPGDGRVPLNYGGFHIEAMDSHGGWDRVRH